MLTVLSRICPSVRYIRDRSIALANYTSSFANTFPSHTALPSAQASTPPAGNSCTTRPSAFLDPSLRTGVKFSRRRDVVGWRREPLVFLARSTVKLRRTDLYSTNCFDSGLRWFHWYLQIYFRDPVRSKQATQENTKKQSSLTSFIAVFVNAYIQIQACFGPATSSPSNPCIGSSGLLFVVSSVCSVASLSSSLTACLDR